MRVRVQEVRAAHATDEGWTAWAAPHAEIDWRVGGTIRTHYGPDAAVGDEGRTRVRSHGIGYRDAKEYDELLGFFMQASEGLYRGWIARARRPDGQRGLIGMSVQR